MKLIFYGCPIASITINKRTVERQLGNCFAALRFLKISRIPCFKTSNRTSISQNTPQEFKLYTYSNQYVLVISICSSFSSLGSAIKLKETSVLTVIHDVTSAPDDLGDVIARMDRFCFRTSDTVVFCLFL